MCGIVGIVHRDGEAPVRAAVVERMLEAIRHRGPDDAGTFVDGQVGLGMRRLSIIDLSGGHQPVFNEDRSCAIVYNGETYNYRELRSGLIARGHAMRTHSDTETIVHLYEELGAGCVEPLRGMFGFALWDARNRSLLLARDRFGIKPLYVVEADWGLAFASELKALHAAGLTPSTLDWHAMDMYLQLGYIPAPYTPFPGVRKLEPGCTLTWKDGACTVRRYWDIPRSECETPPDIEGAVRGWIDDSVRAHLESDVPLAVFLSGGLDSSAVLSSMASGGQAPHAFTVRYRGSGALASDESGLARALADRYGAKLTVLDVTADVRDLFDPIIRCLDEPHADESAIPSWLIAEAVAREYKVALAGTGGDELFAGYRRHVGLLLGDLYSRLPLALRRAASAVADAIPEPSGASLDVNRAKRFLRQGDAGVPDRYVDIITRLADGLRSELYQPGLAATTQLEAVREHFRRLHGDGGAHRGVRAALYFDYRTYLPDDILMLADRTSMAHSLEVRVPFVDHVLVEQVFPLPDRVRLGRRLQAKHLLRRALTPRLTDAHLRAPKRGFVGPTATWLRHELRDLITDELSADRLRRLGYFRPEAVRALLEDHLSLRHNRAGILWGLLCFQGWHRHFVEQHPAPYQPDAGGA